jgi:spore germination cell wall hydrolase CwlJ-like protein
LQASKSPLCRPHCISQNGRTLTPRRFIRGPAFLAAALAVLAISACAPEPKAQLSYEQQRFAAQGLSDGALLKITAQMDPSIRALARRHDPGLRRADLWNRPEGWASLDIRNVPDLGIEATDAETAEQLNALQPFAGLPIRPMRPFVLTVKGDDRDRAIECLSQAVYYEAAREPKVGQEAVAQVVLNRMRHPAYPKSICGVVYQGAARATGCQFTFTCDGSLRWAPEPALWSRAQAVAKRALAGYVDKDVGSATHYHAAYVAPYWAPTLVKMTQVGAHIFYRWTGPWGEPAAFVGRYAGREAELTPALLTGFDPRTQGGLLAPEKQGVPALRKVTLAVAGEVRTYTVADATASGGERTRVMGTIAMPRRKATPDEIKQINERLAIVERDLDAPPSADKSAAPVSAAAPATTQD